MNQSDASSFPSSVTNNTTYRKRKKTLKKKSEELSILCGVPVGLVCIESSGNIETWPEDRRKVDEILKLYLKKATKTSDTSVFQKRSRNPSADEEVKMKKRRKLRYETWNPYLDYLPEESLIEILEHVERNEKILEERILREKKRGLGIRVCGYSKSSSPDSENFSENSDRDLGCC